MDELKKIFLTGGTGFIGSHVLKQAELKNLPVKALRRSPGSHARLPLSQGPEWIEGEIDELTPTDFDNCESVIHLASPGVSPQKAEYLDLMYWNIVAFERLLDVAAQAGVKRFVIAGTFAEYGLAANHYSVIPSDCALLPTTNYAASKAAAWMAAQAFAVEKKVEVCWLRIFSAYGEGQHEENFWPALKRAALAGEDFHMSPGEQIRDYVKVERVAQVLLEASTSMRIDPGFPMQFNVGSGTPVTMKEFAMKFWKEWNAKGKLMVGAIPYRDNEVMRFVPDPDTLLR